MEALGRLTEALSDRYHIERELGAGGMATVYLAHDRRHDRKVALKVLKPELSAILGAERFLKEIRTTANLQHPHILPLHDSGEADGTVFYVMPFVEGETLRDRLEREQQLPVDDAVRIAREVLDALSYAHMQGVIHRDIKPENILLYGGHALVADFGIALAASRSEGSKRLTETGMSLGTPAYMAPEQAMGDKAITPRVDIYAVGCVLYEMLSGEPPFTGPTAQAIVARVMTEEPRSLTLQRHTVPPHVEAAVRQALEKLPADRFATAEDFRAALADRSFSTTSQAAHLRMAGGRFRAENLLWGIAAAAVLLASGVLLRRPPVLPVTRYGLVLPPGQAPLANRRVVPSPDGSSLLYVGPVPGGSPSGTPGAFQLWLKPRDQYAARPLAGTEGAWNVTFSPDGRWIAFIQDGHLRKLAVGGGSPTTLADSAAPLGAGIAWLDNGTIVYIGLGLALRQVHDGGGAAIRVHSDSLLLSDPTPLPGGRVLYTRCADPNCAGRDVWALDPVSRVAREVIPGAAYAQYLPTGHVVYVRRDGVVLAARFNARGMRMDGSPVAIFDSVTTTNGGYPLFQVSASGTLAMRTGSRLETTAGFDMTWVDRAGRVTPIDMGGPLNIDPYFGQPGWALSPDGRRLAIGLVTAAGSDIWVKQLPDGPLSRVTFDSQPDSRPRWIQNGRAIAFVAVRNGELSLHKVMADGTGPEEVLARHRSGIWEGTVSPDGTWIVARAWGGIGQGSRDIVGFRHGDTTAVPLIANPVFDEDALALSPDGHWIAYESNESGRREVYVRPFPNTNAGKWQASASGGYAPLWARSGRELFFVDAGRYMTAVTFTPGPEPRFGERRTLFALGDDPYRWEDENYTPYDVSPDGQRFLIPRRRRAQTSDVAPLIVVDNWFTELRRKMEGH